MRKNIIKRVIFILVVIFVAGVAVFLFSVYSHKSFQYFMKKGDTGEPTKLVLQIWGNQEERYNQEYIIDHPDALKTFVNVLDSVTFSPLVSVKEYGGDKEDHWRFELTDASDRALGMLDMGTGRGKELVSMGVYENRVKKETDFYLNMQYYMTDRDKKKIADTMLDIINEYIGNITLEDVFTLGEQQVKDFDEFERYYYEWSEEYEDTILESGDMNNVVCFDIDDSDLKLYVWYQREILDDGEKVSFSQEIRKAELQDDKGNRYSIYEKNIRNMVEETG